MIYVDDIIIAGGDPAERAKLEQGLMKEFAVKTLGRMKYFLGFEIAHSSNDIILSKKKHILDLQANTGFRDSQPTKTPIEVNHRLTLNKDAFHAGRCQMERLNKVFLVLIPKNPGALQIGDFRPTALSNSIYLIIAKVLPNCLREVMDDLISPLECPEVTWLSRGVGAVDEALRDHIILLRADKWPDARGMVPAAMGNSTRMPASTFIIYLGC